MYWDAALNESFQLCLEALEVENWNSIVFLFIKHTHLSSIFSLFIKHTHLNSIVFVFINHTHLNSIVSYLLSIHTQIQLFSCLYITSCCSQLRLRKILTYVFRCCLEKPWNVFFYIFTFKLSKTSLKQVAPRIKKTPYNI